MYKIRYTNINHREEAPAMRPDGSIRYPTIERAKEAANFLKFQGAKRITIMEVK